MVGSEIKLQNFKNALNVLVQKHEQLAQLSESKEFLRAELDLKVGLIIQCLKKIEELAQEIVDERRDHDNQ